VNELEAPYSRRLFIRPGVALASLAATVPSFIQNSAIGLVAQAAANPGLAGVPGSSFFREPEHRYIRFHFAKKEETLRAAGERLLRLREFAGNPEAVTESRRRLSL
jgi:aspartate/methionine/tyrosine aminotransferase